MWHPPCPRPPLRPSSKPCPMMPASFDRPGGLDSTHIGKNAWHSILDTQYLMYLLCFLVASSSQTNEAIIFIDWSDLTSSIHHGQTKLPNIYGSRAYNHNHICRSHRGLDLIIGLLGHFLSIAATSDTSRFIWRFVAYDCSIAHCHSGAWKS